MSYATDGNGTADPADNRGIQVLGTSGVTGSTAAPAPGYKFEGWYKGDARIEGAGAALSAELAAANVDRDGGLYKATTFTAKFVPDFSTLSASGFDVTYDGAPHKVLLHGVVLPGDTIEYWVGDTQLAANEFVNVADSTEVTVKVIRGTQVWTSNSVTARITPAPATIKVNDSSKKFGESDPAFTGAVEGLIGSDSLGNVVYSRTNNDEAVGSYAGVLTATVDNLNGNYTYTVEPGDFSIEPADGNIVRITSDAEGLTKVYDAQPVSVTAEADVEGSTLLYSVDNGATWSESNPSFTNAGTYTVHVKATHPGYRETAPVSATVVITPAPVTITVADASKVAGAADPTFTGTVEGLVAEGDLGDVAYVRPGGEEAVGVYQGALTALFTQNPNYAVSVINGTFTITAPPIPPIPSDPVEPTPTPTPLPEPGTVPPDSPLAPIVAPIVDVLGGAAEAVIGDNETPLAQRETEISDGETPLAGHDHASCWVHWYIILGIIVTAIYSACVTLRRSLFSRKLKQYEDNLTGGGDPAPGAPSRFDDEASAANVSQGAPAGTVAAAGLNE